MRPTLAISLFVDGQRAVVIGSGPTAAERAARLTEAGALITPVDEAAYTEGTGFGHQLVLVCDEAQDVELARRVHAASKIVGFLCYAQDRPEFSDFALPALIRRGPVQVTVSTQGSAPSLARRLREELEKVLDPRLGDYAEKLAIVRAELPVGQRREILSGRVAGLRIDGSLILPED
jgi:siroheme synthase (precorrin-2 oxidase/ferrochelatase)